ncbi:hypothetical protein [Sandaracinus amylolyticus]|uniref:hypothetical protein n=1 Tax=Sandaracinus amylolyticus TaxID=927083 RepID=UPI001F305AEA|nr:hypothetical protein [Sandaracinus amylolyticus]UJR85157.1 Hypothetical protein I5071_72370 [Sandaracinus amylolyticus]
MTATLRASWLVGAAVVLVTIVVVAYLWLFEVRGRVATLSATPFGAYVVTQHQRRAAPWLPWLPTHELEVSDASGPRWRIRVRDTTPWNDFGASHLARGDELLVEDRDAWHGRELATGALRWSGPLARVFDARVLGDVTLVVDHDLRLWAMDHASGVARWSLGPVSTIELEMVDVMGAAEIVIDQSVIDLRTGRVLLALPSSFAVADDELLWIARFDTVMRRRAGEQPRAALTIPGTFGWMDAHAAGDQVLVHLHRTATWADVTARAEPRSVRMDELTDADDVIAAIGPDDDMRWILAVPHAVFDSCVLDEQVIVFGGTRVVGGEHAVFAVDVETGTVLPLDARSPCP